MGIIFSHWVNLNLALRFHALLIVTMLSLYRIKLLGVMFVVKKKSLSKFLGSFHSEVRFAGAPYNNLLGVVVSVASSTMQSFKSYWTFIYFPNEFHIGWITNWGGNKSKRLTYLLIFFTCMTQWNKQKFPLVSLFKMYFDSKKLSIPYSNRHFCQHYQWCTFHLTDNSAICRW